MNRADLRFTNRRWPSNLLPAFTNLSCPWCFLLVGGTLSHMKGHSSGLYEPSTPVLLMSAKKNWPSHFTSFMSNPFTEWYVAIERIMFPKFPLLEARSPRPWSELMAMACMGCLEVMDTSLYAHCLETFIWVYQFKLLFQQLHARAPAL